MYLKSKGTIFYKVVLFFYGDFMLFDTIYSVIQKKPDEIQAYNDLFSLCRNEEEGNFDLSHAWNKKLRQAVAEQIKVGSDISAFFELYRKTLLFDAKIDFDSYLLYLEIDRKPQDRFYQPRRKILKQAVDAIQDLADGELDELFIHLPPRVGKTTLLMLAITWIIGRNSELSNLYSAYSDTITKAFYNGVLEIINDNVTYRWHDIFPEAKVVQTNSQDETLNIDRRKRYPSLTARSLYGTLNGACDCNGFLISDDLIGGIEEALSKDRLISAWGKVDNNLIPRAKETAKMLWVGTRWSMIDPFGLRRELLENDERFSNRKFKVITIPALNENDESNFDYDYGVGYSTDYYKQRRASFERNNDIASWTAQYMGEPIERDGALFSPNEFRYYNGILPEEQPDRVFIAVDPAFGGGDFVAAPIIYQYGNDLYVHDVVYDNGDKRITQPLLVNAVIEHKANAMQIEATKATEGYKDGIEQELAKQGVKINLTTKSAPTTKSKQQRIFDKAPDIRELMVFRESGKRSKAYELFMQNVFTFKMFAKNKNDDAPDSLAMAIDMLLRPKKGIEVFRRPF